MASTDPTADDFVYDEFAYFVENVAEVGLEWPGPPMVRRTRTEVEAGRNVSALRWGTDPVQAVFVHGTGQNAHTWDTVILAMSWPAPRRRPSRPWALRLERRSGL